MMRYIPGALLVYLNFSVSYWNFGSYILGSSVLARSSFTSEPLNNEVRCSRKKYPLFNYVRGMGGGPAPLISMFVVVES